MSVCLLVVLVAGFQLGFFIAKQIIGAKVRAATVSVEDMELKIEGDANVMHPHFKIFAPAALLEVPLLSFEARVDPMEVSVYTPVEAMRRPGDEKPHVFGKVGVVKIGEFTVRSGEDVNLDMTGNFSVVSNEFLSATVRNSIQMKSLTVEMKGSASMRALLWGLIPVWMSGVHIEYDLEVATFDGFRQQPPSLNEIESASGKPKLLEARCSVNVFNPSIATVNVQDEVEFRIAYNLSGAMFDVGYVRASNFHVVPGHNLVTGDLYVVQTPSNALAIGQVATDYIGGVQEGFEPSGMRAFTVHLQDDGQARARSPIIREALRGLDVRVSFRPKPIRFVTQITADVTIGGSLFSHWPPSVYVVSLHVWVHNPLPQEVRVNHLHVEAHSDNLSGPMLYLFDHVVNPADFVLPPSATVPLTVELVAGEIVWPGLKAILETMEQALSKVVYVGVDAEFGLTVMPGFDQQVSYKNNRIYGIICYHATEPSSICGNPQSDAALSQSHSGITLRSQPRTDGGGWVAESDGAASVPGGALARARIGAAAAKAAWRPVPQLPSAVVV